jgi:cytochrome c-type biogenesis protein CcmH
VIPFLFAAVAMTLTAVALVVVPLFREKSAPAPIAAVLSALAIPAAVTLMYAAVSSYPWSVAVRGSAGAVTAQSAVADTPEISALKERVRKSPDDAAGWISLGDGYMGQERFADAREAYREAIHLSGENRDDLRLAYAESSVLQDRQALMGEAGKIVDEVLSRNPMNPKALWYGGMAALGRGDTAAAKSRWSKLLELSPPPQVRQVIEQQLASLGGGAPGGADAPRAPSGTTIPVRVAVKPELAGRIKAGASLFLIARAPGAAGPPLAVVRRNSASLPLELEISDADSMVPGRSLAGLAEVKLTARIANDGQALAAPGDVFGDALWSPGSPSGDPLQILMDQIVQ